MLKSPMKNWPGGSYLVMNSTPIVPVDRHLMAIGCKYNSHKVIGFVATEGAGSTVPGDIYLYCCPDMFSNVSVHSFVRPRK